MRRACPAVCAALRRKYIKERPGEYLAAFTREHGVAEGLRRWRAFKAAMDYELPPMSGCPLRIKYLEE